MGDDTITLESNLYISNSYGSIDPRTKQRECGGLRCSKYHSGLRIRSGRGWWCLRIKNVDSQKPLNARNEDLLLSLSHGTWGSH